MLSQVFGAEIDAKLSVFHDEMKDLGHGNGHWLLPVSVRKQAGPERGECTSVPPFSRPPSWDPGVHTEEKHHTCSIRTKSALVRRGEKLHSNQESAATSSFRPFCLIISSQASHLVLVRFVCQRSVSSWSHDTCDWKWRSTSHSGSLDFVGFVCDWTWVFSCLFGRFQLLLIAGWTLKWIYETKGDWLVEHGGRT